MESFNISHSNLTIIDSKPLSIFCITCETSGNLTLSTIKVKKHQGMVKKIKGFFDDPVQVTLNKFGLNLNLHFGDVRGYFEFEIQGEGDGEFKFPLYMTETPIGMALSDELSVGVVLFIDLVFSSAAKDELDMNTGFEFSFPLGANISVDSLNGDVLHHKFNEGPMKSLPILVRSGTANFTAALRVHVQCGVSGIIAGNGYDVGLSVFANILEYQSRIERNTIGFEGPKEKSVEASDADAGDENNGDYVDKVDESQGQAENNDKPLNGSDTSQKSPATNDVVGDGDEADGENQEKAENNDKPMNGSDITQNRLETNGTVGGAENQTTSDCDMLAEQVFDVNIGAYAHALAKFDYKAIGFSPTSTITVYQHTISDSCIRDAPKTAPPTTTTPKPDEERPPTTTTSSSEVTTTGTSHPMALPRHEIFTIS
ncbi:Bgt-3014 [Blumeria graminis f. sp. tritici]|uniref:Bgt-3014 n=2 Tax=Blumeria graminis f. sp. tritici TaxID=62690 RepID=A0A9X9L7Y8_BLUGR|nr:hypothetical protein BGT96224_3014 [Blumeria graminis f. sp. tritici 96224]VCU39019.1 Bgt-3014 [Blumeria graminis f. sp. tritici]